MEYRAIGKILKPVGVRGAVKVLPLSESVERLLKLKHAWIGRNLETIVEQHIADTHQVHGKAVLRFEGICTLQEAEALRNFFVFVNAVRQKVKKKGHYFIDEIIGCQVVTEEEKKVGIIRDVLKLPANDLWVVGDSKKEVLIPAVKEFIRSVDVQARRIIIHEIDGLLD